MRVTEVVRIEGCVGGPSIFELRLNEEMDRDFIHRLGSLGRLEYFADFSRPFFRVTRPKQFILRGVQGSTCINSIILRDTDANLALVEAGVGSPPMEGEQNGEAT
jgi:hypothetical protein